MNRGASAPLIARQHSDPGPDTLSRPPRAVAEALRASRERASARLAEREQEERIRMRDCRSMVGLIDAVNTGKLQAMIVAQRAGYFGGSGAIAQHAWVGLGTGFGCVGHIALVNYGLGRVEAWQFVKSGTWLGWLFWAACIVRATFLRRLEAHAAEDAEAERAAAAHAQGGAPFDPLTGKPLPGSQYMPPVVNPAGVAAAPQLPARQQPLSEHKGELATMRTSNVLKYSVGQEVHNMGAHGISGVIESLVADTGTSGPGVIAIRRAVAPAARTVLDEAQLAEQAAKDAVAAAKMERVKEENRLAQFAHQGLVGAMASGGLALFWFGSYYTVQCNPVCFDLFPLFPSVPTKRFMYATGLAFVVASAGLLHSAWLTQDGNMQGAQTALVKSQFVLGVVLLIDGLGFCSGVWPRVLLSLFGLSGLGMGYGLQRYLSLRQADAMTEALQQDIEAYDRAWKKIIAVPQQKEALHQIMELVALHEDEQKARKRNHMPAALGMQGRDTRDQLMIMVTQAWGLNDKFQRFARDWKASVTFGGDLRGGDESEEKGLLPKRRTRAIEKVWRAYGGDATRLRDLVRCSIVFDAVADMHQCLRTIVEDRRIAVQEVKNRVSFDYDSAASCGYRDIQVILLRLPPSGALRQTPLSDLPPLPQCCAIRYVPRSSRSRCSATSSTRTRCWWACTSMCARSSCTWRPSTSSRTTTGTSGTSSIATSAQSNKHAQEELLCR